jgi:hypothetical protein
MINSVVTPINAIVAARHRRRARNFAKDFDRIGTKRPDDQQKLHDIQPPLSSFNRRDDRLRLTEPPRQFDLCDVGPRARSGQSCPNDFVMLGLNPFWGCSQWIGPVASLNQKIQYQIIK